MIRRVHAKIVRLRVGQLTLRVGGDRRLEAGLEVGGRQTGNAVLLVLALLSFLTEQRSEGHRLTNATTVLTGRAFGGDELRRVGGDRDLALGSGQRQRTGRIPAAVDEVVRVHADVLRIPAVRRMAKTERNGHRIGTHPHVAVRGRGNLARRRFDGEMLPFNESEFLEGGGVNFNPRLPRNLGDGIRELLQPRLVRTASITKGR